MQAQFIEQVSLSESLFEQTFLVQGQRFFQAGQYQQIFANKASWGPFSFVSTPQELPFIKFLSRQSLPLQVGDKVTLSEPKGSMTLESLKLDNINLTAKANKSLPLIAIGGGTGLSPFISLAKAHHQQKFKLYWSYKRHSDKVLIDKYLTSCSHVQLVDDFFQENNLDSFLSLLPLDSSCSYLIAGPYVFVDLVGDFLQRHGVLKIYSDMKSFPINLKSK